MGKPDNTRIVVTGLGVISPLGLDTASTWTGILAGKSGAGPITRFDASSHETTFAAEVKGFEPADILGRKESRRMDRFAQLGVAAAIQAVEDASLVIDDRNASRVGVIIATGMGAIETIEEGMETLLDQGPRRVGPFFMPMMLANMASGHVSMVTGAKGPNLCTVSACASSAHAIGEAAQWVANGVSDAVIAGGCEAPVSRLSVAGFNAMGALSTRNEDPEGASRPFDAGRDGFVIAEGAAVVVLESLDHAQSRGARIYGEVVGYGSTDDANHVVQPAPEGEGAARAIGIALKQANLRPEQIDYVNAHGTSTPLNEKFETMAIKSAFGEHAYRVPISSTKSMTGHLLGAAGSLEAAFSLLAMRDGVIPPTINYQTPDADCDLDCVPNTSRQSHLRHVMSNSNGFGGHNVALIFSHLEE